MRIGIDLDDTIFCTIEQYKKYQTDYLLKKILVLMNYGITGTIE